MNYKDIFSNNLVYLRKHFRLNQEQAAEHLNISRSTLASYEVGNTEPNITTLLKMSEFFNVSVEALVTTIIKESDIVLSSDFNETKLKTITQDEKDYYIAKTKKVQEIIAGFKTIYKYKKTKIKSSIQNDRILSDIDNFLQLIDYIIKYNLKVLK